LKTQLKKAFEADLPRPVLERRVIGFPSYYWTNGELDRLQARLLSREAIAADGLFDYEALQDVLEAERRSDAKSRGKHAWALTQLSLWHRIHVRRDPEFSERAAQG
jgi:asparagine synthetase B (glutamine-hydrolysing)